MNTQCWERPLPVGPRRRASSKTRLSFRGESRKGDGKLNIELRHAEDVKLDGWAR